VNAHTDWVEEAINTSGAILAVQCDGDTLTQGYVQKTPDGALVVLLADGQIVPADQARPRVVGRLRANQSAALSRLGPTFTSADLWMVVAGDENWPPDGDEYSYAPDRPQSQVAQCSSEQVRLLARNLMFSVFVCITDRLESDVLAPGFFGPIADQLERHSQIWTTCAEDSAKPIYLRLVVDIVRHLDRTVVVRVLERVQPACPRLRPPAAAAARPQARDPAGRFQPRSSDAA
jgi:hypothetical protein